MKKHRLLFLCCIFALLFVLTAWYIYEHRPKTICELYNINTDEIVSVSFVLDRYVETEDGSTAYAVTYDAEDLNAEKYIRMLKQTKWYYISYPSIADEPNYAFYTNTSQPHVIFQLKSGETYEFHLNFPLFTDRKSFFKINQPDIDPKTDAYDVYNIVWNYYEHIYSGENPLRTE